MIQLSPDSSLGSILGQGFGQGMGQAMQQRYQQQQTQTALQNLFQRIQANPNASIQEKLMAAQQSLAGLPPEQQQIGLQTILQQYQEDQRLKEREQDRLFGRQDKEEEYKRNIERDRIKFEQEIERDRLKRSLDEAAAAKAQKEEDEMTAAYTQLLDEFDITELSDNEIREAALAKKLTATQANKIVEQARRDKKGLEDEVKGYEAQYGGIIAEYSKMAKDASAVGDKKGVMEANANVNRLLAEKEQVLSNIRQKFKKKPKAGQEGAPDTTGRPTVPGQGRDYDLPIATPDIYDKTLTELFGQRANTMDYETMTAQEQSLFIDAIKKKGYQLPADLRDTYGKTTPENVRKDYELQKAKIQLRNKREKEAYEKALKEWQEREQGFGRTFNRNIDAILGNLRDYASSF